MTQQIWVHPHTLDDIRELRIPSGPVNVYHRHRGVIGDYIEYGTTPIFTDCRLVIGVLGEASVRRGEHSCITDSPCDAARLSRSESPEEVSPDPDFTGGAIFWLAVPVALLPCALLMGWLITLVT